jgi:cell shape-determining protein MreC
MGKIIRFPINKKEVSEVKSELPERLERIRDSFSRINQLMAELKKLSEEGSTNVNSSKR